MKVTDPDCFVSPNLLGKPKVREALTAPIPQRILLGNRGQATSGRVSLCPRGSECGRIAGSAGPQGPQVQGFSAGQGLRGCSGLSQRSPSHLPPLEAGAMAMG